MSPRRPHHLVLALLVAALAFATGCASRQAPRLTVLGLEQSGDAYEGRRIKLFVEVVNYAKRPMRLQRLQYAFGAGGASGAGVVELGRTVGAGEAIVVEVPILLDGDAQLVEGAGLTLEGRLFAEQDQIIHSFPVRAAVDATGTGTTRVGTPGETVAPTE